MRRIFDSLLFRTAALFLFGLLALQAAVVIATMSGDARPAVFRLVDPRDAREIAESVERAPPALRPLIVAAASNSGTTVQLLPSSREDAEQDGLRPAPRLEERFRRYAAELEGRPVRVQVREGGVLSWNSKSGEPPRGPVRLLVTLRDGETLAIERAPVVLQRIAARYFIVALCTGAILAALLLILLWQVVRPVARLARATEAFRDDLHASDAPVGGAPEIQTLARAFNDMKQRISGLVAERAQMAAAVAHDLRTYLTRLRLRADHIADAGQRERAVRDIEEMGKLLDDMLLFARAEAGLDRNEDVAVIDARAEAIGYVDIRRETGGAVELIVAAEPLPCRCTSLAYRRILANLVDNALQYGLGVEVTLQREDDMVVTIVTDEGPGIPDELIDRVTGPFERLEASRGRHSGGAGLGLSIVKALAHGVGGTLSLENRAAGGLRAVVRLPCVGAQ